MTVEIRIGDCRELLKAMPDESVNCVVTSPPYWGLRDYGVAGQIGMEKTLGEHIAVLVDVFREVRRVLRKDGTCWINYGDCYATTPNGKSAAAYKADKSDDRTFRDKPFSTIGPIFDPNWRSPETMARRARRKSNGETHRTEDGVPFTGKVVAGGYMKPKDLCMVANRLAIALQDDGWWVRSEIIWHKPNPMPESITDRPACAHEKVFLLSRAAKYFYNADAVRQPMAAASIERLSQDVDSQAGSTRQPGKTNGAMKAVGTLKQDGHSRRHAGFNERYFAKGNAKTFRGGNYANGVLGGRDSHGNEPNDSGLVNLRNVWTIATAAFSEAHFATFPPALVEPCIKAGCPEGGVTLDPFGGAGTVALVADRLQRNAILFELNPEYAAIAERRLRSDGGMFIDVKTEHTAETGKFLEA